MQIKKCGINIDVGGTEEDNSSDESKANGDINETRDSTKTADELNMGCVNNK